MQLRFTFSLNFPLRHYGTMHDVFALDIQQARDDIIVIIMHNFIYIIMLLTSCIPLNDFSKTN